MTGRDGVPLGQPSERVESLLMVVDEVPEGAVVSYGDVARLCGVGGARVVGQAMARWGSGTRWWRVVRADGTLPPGHESEAAARLREEGVRIVDGRVDMTRHRWQPPHGWTPPHRRD